MGIIEQFEITSSPVTYTLERGAANSTTYFLYGTHTMSGAITFNFSADHGHWAGTTFLYAAELSNYSIGSNYVSFAGTKLPAELADKKCIIKCQWDSDNDVWVVWITPSSDETGWVVSGAIGSGTVTTAKLDTTGGSEAVSTSTIRAEAVTNAKLAPMANSTIKGNNSGGSAVPQDLSATEVRTLLDQDITLTGDVTGTATQTFATGVTSVTTSLAAGCVDVAELTNTVKTELLTCPISFESGALTAGSGYFALKVPYACTVEEYAVSVVELIENTDDATVTLYNNAGLLMGSSSITVTKGTKPATSAPASGSIVNSSSISSNNGLTAGQIISIRAQKTTAGGRAVAVLKVKRA